MARETDRLLSTLAPQVIDGVLAYALSKVSQALVEAGETERARRMGEEALNTAQEPIYFSEVSADVCGILAKVGETQKALDMARGLASEYSPSALSNISQALSKAGQIEKAQEVLKEALDISGLIDSDPYRVSALCHISVALAEIGESEKASAVIEEALITAESIEDRTENQVTHWNAVANVVEALAEIGETQRALDIAEGIGFDMSRVHAFSSISEALAGYGNVREAKQAVEEALRTTERIRTDWTRARALSKIYMALRSIEQAQSGIGEDAKSEKEPA